MKSPKMIRISLTENNNVWFKRKMSYKKLTRHKKKLLKKNIIITRYVIVVVDYSKVYKYFKNN